MPPNRGPRALTVITSQSPGSLPRRDTITVDHHDSAYICGSVASSTPTPVTPRSTCVAGQSWQISQHNPLNWSHSRKWLITVLLSAFSFNTLMTSTMVVPALAQIQTDLCISSVDVTQIILSAYPLAYVCGFLLWGPLSEVYGRLPILQIAGTWFLIWNLVCSFAQNQATMIVGRLFSGIGAAAVLAISPGVLGDVWRPEQRGHSLAVLSLLALMGLAVGGVLGGAVAQQGNEMWRTVFWGTTTYNAILQMLALALLNECHAPTIQKRLAKRTAVSETRGSTRLRFSLMTLRIAMQRPFVLFWTQPSLQLLTLYTGLSFGIMYLLISTFSTAFQDVYGQSIMISSLNFLSIGLGMTLGAQACAPITDYLYRRKTAQYQRRSQDDEKVDSLSSEAVITRQPPAEIRLIPFIPAIFITAAGILLYGWTLQSRTHWVGPNIGIALIGVGNQAMTQCTNAYVIDSFSQVKERRSIVDLREDSGITINISASAMCAVWAAKSLGGFSFPLAAPRMLAVLGWGWTCTVLAGCTILIGVPVAGVLLWKGGSWREKRSSRT